MAIYRDNHWEWIDEGTPDQKRRRGRIYHKRIRFIHGKDGHDRIYKLGDTVTMSGDQDETWTAQIVELFQAREDDDELRQILIQDTKRRTTKLRYELMRVTLRWFYNYEDMNRTTLKRSSVPEPMKHEIYFSDHMEKPGYNDVQVIEGRAWLFSTRSQLLSFEKDPSKEFVPDYDRLKVVRCFVNSHSADLVVRELERNELQYLLKHPTTDQSLYETSRARLFGSAGAVLKGTGRKRSKYSRQPIDISGDLDSLDDDDVKIEEDVVTTKSPKRSSTRKTRRKIIDDVDSDEDSDQDDSFAVIEDNQVEIPPPQPRDPAADPEVLDLIAEFNSNADNAKIPDNDVLNSLFENEITPVSDNVQNQNGKNDSSSRVVRHETIVIDELDGLGKGKRKEKKKKTNPFLLPKGDLTDRTTIAKQNKQKMASTVVAEKPKSVFKPTRPERKSHSNSSRKKASLLSATENSHANRTKKLSTKETIVVDESPPHSTDAQHSRRAEMEMDVPDLIIVDSPPPPELPTKRHNEKHHQANKKKGRTQENHANMGSNMTRDQPEDRTSKERKQSSTGQAQSADPRALKRKRDSAVSNAESRKRNDIDWDEELENVLAKFSVAFNDASTATQGAVQDEMDFIVQSLLEKFASYSDGRIADMSDQSLHSMVKDVIQQLVKAS